MPCFPHAFLKKLINHRNFHRDNWFAERLPFSCGILKYKIWSISRSLSSFQYLKLKALNVLRWTWDNTFWNLISTFYIKIAWINYQFRLSRKYSTNKIFEPKSNWICMESSWNCHDDSGSCRSHLIKPHLHALKKSAQHAKFLAPCLVYPCRDYLREVKFWALGATLHLGPIRLYVENWECRTLKSSARCQKFCVLCRFF